MAEKEHNLMIYIYIMKNIDYIILIMENYIVMIINVLPSLSSK